MSHNFVFFVAVADRNLRTTEFASQNPRICLKNSAKIKIQLDKDTSKRRDVIYCAKLFMLQFSKEILVVREQHTM